ncbi:MAG TPA: discoidin domain-containing protein [Clostridia bacterium]|nr:discoidin domain-containing protein [Clostridia bacterium]
MKKKKIIILLYILLIASVTISVSLMIAGASVNNAGNITIVQTPEQTKAETPPEFKTSEPVIPPQPEGVNLALHKPVEANGYTQVYVPTNATDGKITTYWEGKANSYPNIVTVDLHKVSTITSIRIALNPNKIWSKRVQTFSINCSDDGKTFKELIPTKDYTFDPMTGNIVDIKLDSPAKTRYIQIIFTANTGATGGQIGELEIYGPGD